MAARLGAEVCVQGLAAPLIAAGHAGLACLALVCVVQGAEEQAEVSRLLERVEDLADGLDRLLLDIVPDLALAARAHADEAPR